MFFQRNVTNNESLRRKKEQFASSEEIKNYSATPRDIMDDFSRLIFHLYGPISSKAAYQATIDNELNVIDNIAGVEMSDI